MFARTGRQVKRRLLLIRPLFSCLLPSEALARAHADTDGKVPLVWECFGLGDENALEGQHTCGKTVVGAWPSAEDPQEYRNEVNLDWCKTFRDGGGLWDLYRIYRHEMAHARDGWDHGEGTPEENPAYCPRTYPTGC